MATDVPRPSILRATAMTYADRRIGLIVFVTLFITYVWFHQGGGWNQNCRFDQVRSIVEAGQWQINGYVAYEATRNPDGSLELARRPYPEPFVSSAGLPLPNSGDLAIHDGRVYPTKPPGTTLLGVPTYWALYHFERALGLDPDDWSVFMFNFYFTSALSVGILGAAGVAAFYWLSRRVFPDSSRRAALAATWTFGLGTMMLPFSTMFFDHAAVASLLIVAAWLAHAGSQRHLSRRRAAVALCLAGLACGMSVVTNYAALLVVGPLMLMAVVRAGLPAATWMCVGGIAPAAFLAWYHTICFGGPLVISTVHQLAEFNDPNAIALGMFGVPRVGVLVKLLLSEYRGLFVTSPVLLMGVAGLWLMFTTKQHRLMAVVSALACLLILLMNASFNAWHGGDNFGPRYLMPAMPFFALPLTLSFVRWPRVTLALAAVSCTIMLVATAVDPQVPERYARPMRDYVLPLLAGRSVPDSTALGPVSANIQGVHDPARIRRADALPPQAVWNSFNLGEFVLKRSLWSLAPLILVLVAGVTFSLRHAREGA